MLQIHDVGYKAVVPGNSSRFFDSSKEALQQPSGRIAVSSRYEDPYLFNSLFDRSIIQHDDSYCTSVVDLERSVQVPTLAYIERQVLPHVDSPPRIVDIGCGQGEFVDSLTRMGLPAIGYDPVLRHEARNLHKRYWNPDDPPADLYVMRCVLPHIHNPWDFLRGIAESSPGALVLIEFQQIDWVIRHSLWYQLSHDHVNMFCISNFTERYRVVNYGVFANEEWAWVLIDPGETTNHALAPLDVDVASNFPALQASRDSTIRALSQMDKPLAVWGAAGKGTVLSASLKECGADVVAIDADPLRWGKYLEHSGVRVISPELALKELPSSTQVLVANPNHFSDIKRYVNGRLRVAMPADFGGNHHLHAL